MEDFTELLKLSQKYKDEALKLDEKYRLEVEKIYQNTLKQALNYFGTRVRKNPASPVGAVLRRPDVKSKFKSLFDEAQSKVQAMMEKAYKETSELGAKKAKEEADLLGFEVEPKGKVDPKFLTELKKDLDKQLDDLEDEFDRISELGFGRVDIVKSDRYRTREERAAYADNIAARLSKHVARAVFSVQHRAKLSVSTAVQRGITDGHMGAYSNYSDTDGLKWNKVWVANFTGNVPCAACTALHGEVVDEGEEFPTSLSKGVSVYYDLDGPPLHPNCKCVLVVFPEVDKTINVQMDRSSPSKLKSYARKRTTQDSLNGEEMEGISSKEIREMSPTKFAKWKSKVMGTIKKWWKNLGKKAK